MLVGLLAGCHDAAAPLDAELPVAPAVDAATTLPPLFRFAVVGDTRPVNMDDVSGYPTAVITQIWSDVEAAVPHPDFAVMTGDYMDADPSLRPTTVDQQLDLYLGAVAQFRNAAFPAMGNHECAGLVPSNCGAGNSDGITPNYGEFVRRMLGPYGITTPYYAISFSSSDASWTAKLVVIAANAWTSEQGTWLDGVLAQPTTYTFVVRHEGANVTFAPGVTPSEAIIANYPLTLKIVGHVHTYAHDSGEVTIGNGGAPLSSAIDYGYAIVERLASGQIQLTAYDYASNAIIDQFRVAADGTPEP